MEPKLSLSMCVFGVMELCYVTHNGILSFEIIIPLFRATEFLVNVIIL